MVLFLYSAVYLRRAATDYSLLAAKILFVLFSFFFFGQIHVSCLYPLEHSAAQKQPQNVVATQLSLRLQRRWLSRNSFTQNIVL